MADCTCGHDEDDHGPHGCAGPPNGRFCRCSELEPPPSQDGPETAAKAAPLIEKVIY